MSSYPQLEMKSPRLFEDFRLEGESEGRIREVRVVQSAYDSVLSAGFTYVSTPITSGAILYAAMDAAGVSTVLELQQDKGFFYENVIRPNIDAAESVARKMLAFGGAVIAPAAFEAKSLGWSQGAYMGLWLDTIERKATRIAMVDGWEYSNGGAEEYLQAILMQTGRRDRHDIAVVDARGETLSHATGLKLLAKAIENLVERGFEPVALARVWQRVSLVHAMVQDEFDYGIMSDTGGKTRISIGIDYHDSHDGKEVMRETMFSLRPLRPILERLLPKEELNNRSSAAMAPGLVRDEGRAHLAELPASVNAKDQE